MRLLAITPGDDRDLRPWLVALAEAGLRHVLIREPSRTRSEVADLIGCVPFTVVHERCAGAGELGDAVHLRAGGDPRAWALPAGVSCHSAAEVDAALAAGARYCLLSPVWAPTSKPDDTRPTLGPEAFRAVARDRPVLALGGVTPPRFREVGRAAVLGDLFGQPSPEAAAERLRAYFDQS